MQLVMDKKIDKLDWWDDLSEDQFVAIREAETELDTGQGIPHDKVLEQLDKWLNKRR